MYYIIKKKKAYPIFLSLRNRKEFYNVWNSAGFFFFTLLKNYTINSHSNFKLKF